MLLKDVDWLLTFGSHILYDFEGTVLYFKMIGLNCSFILHLCYLHKFLFSDRFCKSQLFYLVNLIDALDFSPLLNINFYVSFFNYTFEYFLKYRMNN
jgi:hypothetical protein